MAKLTYGGRYIHAYQKFIIMGYNIDTYPATKEDIKEVIEWLNRNAEKLNIDISLIWLETKDRCEFENLITSG